MSEVIDLHLQGMREDGLPIPRHRVNSTVDLLSSTEPQAVATGNRIVDRPPEIQAIRLWLC